jgi:hypothetical protein
MSSGCRILPPAHPLKRSQLASLSPAPLCDAGTVRFCDLIPPIGPEGERILAGIITEQLTLSSSGTFELATEGSTMVIAEIRTYGGICKVMRWAFAL